MVNPRRDAYFQVSISDGVLLYPMHYSLIQICLLTRKSRIIYKDVSLGEIHSWDFVRRLINEAELPTFRSPSLIFRRCDSHHTAEIMNPASHCVYTMNFYNQDDKEKSNECGISIIIVTRKQSTNVVFSKTQHFPVARRSEIHISGSP